MAETIIVETAEGKLRGCVRKNYDNEEFYSFLGVPYAQPPIGNLRFKVPQPIQPWTGVKDATKEGSQFYQKDVLISMTNIVSGTEDGLHLNVFTKKPIPQSSKLNPVMVWIHGGAFKEGQNNTWIYGPEYLMLEDIVLVSINYRLGILGSLRLEDPSLEIFGNTNMKDQVAALKWVQRNIKNFGGDPDNVTIFGESAGGASVQYLVCSPAAKGLFHRAIMQSGVTLNKWAEGAPYFKEMMAIIGKEDLSDKEALEYLRSLSLGELFEVEEKVFETLKQPAPFPEKPNPTAFITKKPLEYLNSGDYNKVPIMLGYCSNEGLILKALHTIESEWAAELEKYTPEFHLDFLFNDKEFSKKIAKKLGNVYGETEAGKIQMSSDVIMTVGVIASAINHSKTSDKPVFLYKLSLDSGCNYLKRLKNIKDQGVSHLDDVGYLFKTSLPFPKKGSPEDGYVRRFVKLWTNFARYGNPTPDGNDLGVTWKPVQEDTVNFLDIDKELIVGTDPDSERMKVWKEILKSNPATAKFM